MSNPRRLYAVHGRYTLTVRGDAATLYRGFAGLCVAIAHGQYHRPTATLTGHLEFPGVRMGDALQEGLECALDLQVEKAA